MRAAIYCRVSTSGQEDNTSLGTQDSRCQAYASEHHTEVISVLTEVASGYTRQRAELTKLRDMIRTGAIDAVIVYAVDRLSRNQTDLAIIIDEMESAKVQLHCVSEPFENSAMGKFILNVRAFVGEMEREKFKERSSRGNLARLQSGKMRPSNRPLYGYQWDDPTRKMKGAYIVDVDKAAIVSRIFNEVASGKTLRKIAEGLTLARYPDCERCCKVAP